LLAAVVFAGEIGSATCSKGDRARHWVRRERSPCGGNANVVGVVTAVMAVLARVTYKLPPRADSALIQVAACDREEGLHRLLEIGIDCNQSGASLLVGDRATVRKTPNHTFGNSQEDMARAANGWRVADLQPPQRGHGRCFSGGARLLKARHEIVRERIEELTTKLDALIKCSKRGAPAKERRHAA